MDTVVDVEKLRESIRKGMEKTNQALINASNKCVENPNKFNNAKASKARKRHNNFVEALEMSDDELVEEFLAGNIFK